MPLLELPIVSADGHTSVLRHHDAGAGRPGLFFLPALGVAAAKYDTFAQALGDCGVSCAVHEWRGLDSSSLRAGRGSDWGYRELLHHDLPASIAALGPPTLWHFGGHSLGGQLAAMAAARQPHRSRGLVLVATGVPHSVTFTGRTRIGVSLFARTMPLLTRVLGYYPGQQLGFSGREAGQLMRDWAKTVRTGRYGHYGYRDELEGALGALTQPVLGLRLSHDWLVPAASLDALMSKLGTASKATQVFDDAMLGTHADHFRWMRHPSAMAARIADWMRLNP